MRKAAIERHLQKSRKDMRTLNVKRRGYALNVGFLEGSYARGDAMYPDVKGLYPISPYPTFNICIHWMHFFHFQTE